VIGFVWACTVAPPPAPPPPPPVTVPAPEPSLPTGETGGLEPGTGDTYGPYVVNLVENGRFEDDGGWEARLGLVAELVPAPQRVGRALFVDDPGSDVSWSWSAPVIVTEGDLYCLRVDTYKTNTTNSGFPRVWVRFYATEEAGVVDALLLDEDFDVLDIDTSEQNRDAAEDVWVPVTQTIAVPEGVGAEALRVILTANASATGQLYWDNVVLGEGACPSG